MSGSGPPRLGVKVTENQKDMMFMSVDAPQFDGRVTSDEFERAWAWLEGEMVKNMASKLGVSGFQIGYSVAILVALLAAVVR